VGVQRFAIGKAEQGGAVVDLGAVGWWVGRPGLGDGGEPGAKGLAVLGGVETEKIGGSVGVAVAGSKTKVNSILFGLFSALAARASLEP
jgi:hypothetical protein